MTKIQSIVFCILSLALTVGVFAWLFPYAAMSESQAQSVSEPATMEEFDLIDLGDDYGQLTIYELVGYFLENPPEPETAATVSRKKHFGGC